MIRETMADKVAACVIPVPEFAELALIRDQLKLPAKNHFSPSSRLSPKVERYVIDELNVQRALSCEPNITTEELCKLAKFPHQAFWLEFCLKKVNLGFAFFVNEQSGWHAAMMSETEDGYIRALAKVHYSPATGASIVPYAPAIESSGTPEEVAETLVLITRTALLLLISMNTPHVASTERVLPTHSKYVLRRREQRGASMFSHNRVRMKVPETSIQRGEIQRKEIRAGVRKHEVRGHWRLIKTKIGDFEFIWIDGYCAGDEALGVIVKTREVVFDERKVRRRGSANYIVPGFAGIPGERIKAERLQ